VKGKKMNYWDEYFVNLSALQKSVRWCEINPSRYFAQELVRMGKSVDVLNRLILIAAEDAGIADPSLIVYERECSNEFERLISLYGIEKKDAFNIPQICEVVDRAAIAAAISYKSRLLPMLSFITLYDIYKKENFSRDLSYYFRQFVDSLELEDERKALYYAFIVGIFFDEMPRVLRVIKERSERRSADLIMCWVEEYERKKERLMLTGSIVLLCRDLQYLHGVYKHGICKHVPISIKEAEIPDRAYDQHTKEGKKRGRGLKHFFQEAATVKNERPPNDYEQEGRNAYYLADQEGLGKAAKLIDAIKSKLRAEVMTI
jgi:hypothetical protein